MADEQVKRFSYYYGDAQGDSILAWQHLYAKNDANGNPRRVFVVWAADGGILEVIDEGYAGTPRWLKDYPQLGSFAISPSEYRELRKVPTVGPAA